MTLARYHVAYHTGPTLVDAWASKLEAFGVSRIIRGTQTIYFDVLVPVGSTEAWHGTAAWLAADALCHAAGLPKLESALDGVSRA
jgi:hypothetical protein